MITVTKHTDVNLLAGRQADWRGVDALPAQEQLRLAELSCLEIRVSDLRGQFGAAGDIPALLAATAQGVLRTQRARRLLNEVASTLIESAPHGAYLVRVSHPNDRSRVRSYKGIFPYGGQIRKTNFRETEIDVGDKSFFIGATKIDDRNRSESFSLAHSSLAFLLLPAEANEDRIWQDVTEILPGCLKFEMIDTPRVVTSLIHRDEAVFTFGWDAVADDWASLCIFASKLRSSEWLAKLENCRDRLTNSEENSRG